ncbi:phosphoribosylformylglycinamidine synthase [Peptoniphilus equinus]|uniref:Phosphoribosylformylglycinamidine synthase n=1 Tax=Peptoniphilus equinus TaxID=3016343 RepID=A0ABY7QSK1_9FIRM|nr:phosphoribosylformylglycinamidine synthase [Peptoniphilus equinus]WBW49722.1 phosphoribosylformylglycinamidine synthase [Peptoniphilus equinus]
MKRIYVTKKDAFDPASKALKQTIERSLNTTLDTFKIYRRYDMQISDRSLEQLLYTVLSEKVVDELYYGEAVETLEAGFENYVRVAYLPGQFDQRRQGLLDTASLLTDEAIDVKVSLVYVFNHVDEATLKGIETLLVNPVDSEMLDLESGLDTTDNAANLENLVYDGFINYTEAELQDFLDGENLAMNLDDLKLIQTYFKKEGRDINETELAILDTYWSDHCRHTTFNTALSGIQFPRQTALDAKIEAAFNTYLDMREAAEVTKPVTLMGLGTILAKLMSKEGKLSDLEVSSEINACSVRIPLEFDEDGVHKTEDYLLMFKNETHNHPTEIEPVGGASTCLGGAIRDPLSGRSYVYQAMRISGAADPRTPLTDTLKGKLPQKKITQEAALGYSSYGNQIGLATGFVNEMYHPGYVAKRLEAGAVIAAAPEADVKRLEPVKGDVIVLLGGKTGRDGIGGATGSSKSHVVSSIKTESAQVQKGNAPEERKIQRLFRNPEATRLIKKCNDFGAGGVSVAIGELSESVVIHLDRVPLKYLGLKPKEIAISESQERMAVVLAPEDLEAFIALAADENLEATHVATVTDNGRMVMRYGEATIADLSYDFIDTNGAPRETEVDVTSEATPTLLISRDMDPTHLKDRLKDLNVTSQKNLIERFDQSVGRGTVLAPLGGKDQTVPAQAMVSRIPRHHADVHTVSAMAYGCNPDLLSASQFLGGYYAVVESVARLVAVGAGRDTVRLSFQEFFERMDGSKAWGKPLKALLGALMSSRALDAPPIGGKDSMSGTFEAISVPPTLISFAVTTAHDEAIIGQNFKGKGRLGVIETPMDDDGLLDMDVFKDNADALHQAIIDKNVLTAVAVTHKGTLAHLYESARDTSGFSVELDDLYSPRYGTFIVEYTEDADFIKPIGHFAGGITVNGVTLDKDDLDAAYLNTLDGVFTPMEERVDEPLAPQSSSPRRMKSHKPVDVVKVVIPAFPGTNSEWDTKEAFERAGAHVDILVFKNRTESELKASLDAFAELIESAQILAIPGGFSMGDEPDGSGKFIANVLRAPRVKAAVETLLHDNDGLILGICNGFQALVKTGLLPYGEIRELEAEDLTLTYNTSHRHLARLVPTRMVSTNSPWLQSLSDDIYRVALSHGEGRFVVSSSQFKTLLENDQVVAQYVENPNGSDYGIESVMSADGKILGKMGHSERYTDGLYKNIDDMTYQDIFTAGVNYFKE